MAVFFNYGMWFGISPVGIPDSSIYVQVLYYSMLYCTVDGTKRFSLLRF